MIWSLSVNGKVSFTLDSMYSMLGGNKVPSR